MRIALACALAMATGMICSTVRAQPPHARPVLIDALVEDARGRPVDSLALDDVIVTERGQRLALESVRFVRDGVSTTSCGGAPGSSGPSGGMRPFGIYIDEYHVTPGPGADLAREAVAGFVRDDLGPGDLVAVLKPLDALTDIRLSEDRDAAGLHIESMRGRQGDPTPRTDFERDLIGGAPAVVLAARARIAAASMAALVARLGACGSGRKTLIVMSEGFAASRLPGGGGAVDADALARAANRANVAVYVVDPRPVLGGVPTDPAHQDALRSAFHELATVTTGRALMADGSLRAGLRRALAEARGYFSLAVRPSGADGHFHEVAVTLRPAGLSVRARRGYWAESTEVVRRPERPQAAALAGLARVTSPLIRSWFGLAPGPAGAVRVSFVWESVPGRGVSRDAAPTAARIALSVSRLDGTQVFHGTVRPSSPAARPGPDEPLRASFVLSPGQFLVQMQIEDETSRVVGRDVRDLVVGALDGPVAMGTPELLRARYARDIRRLSDDPGAAPTAAREFSRAEHLVVRVPVRASGGTPVVTARLLTGFGTVVRSLVLIAVPTRPSTYQAQLPLAALAPGMFAIELRAETADERAAERVEFRVTP